MAGLPHLQGRFGARQHGHLSNSWRISDQDPCPPAPKTLENATGNNDDIHHFFLPMSLSSLYFLKQTWRPIRMNRLGSHHLPVTSPSVPAVSHLFGSFLKVLCDYCYAWHCLSMLYAIWATFAHSHGPCCLISFVTSIATSVLRIGHISLDIFRLSSIFSLAKRCNSKTI